MMLYHSFCIMCSNIQTVDHQHMLDFCLLISVRHLIQYHHLNYTISLLSSVLTHQFVAGFAIFLLIAVVVRMNSLLTQLLQISALLKSVCYPHCYIHCTLIIVFFHLMTVELSNMLMTQPLLDLLKVMMNIIIEIKFSI